MEKIWEESGSRLVQERPEQHPLHWNEILICHSDLKYYRTSGPGWIQPISFSILCQFVHLQRSNLFSILQREHKQVPFLCSCLCCRSAGHQWCGGLHWCTGTSAEEQQRVVVQMGQLEVELSVMREGKWAPSRVGCEAASCTEGSPVVRQWWGAPCHPLSSPRRESGV